MPSSLTPQRLPLLSFLAIILFSSASCSEKAVPGDQGQVRASLLRADARGLRTTHGLAYQFEASAAYVLTDVSDRSDVFNGVRYSISRAAFIGDDSAIMIHAETVTDGSGASNYDALPVVDWPAAGFRSEGSICMSLSEEDIEGEADPEWLVENGFNVATPLVFSQYFLASADYNDEIVVSLFQHVPTCEGGGVKEVLTPLKSAFTATPL